MDDVFPTRPELNGKNLTRERMHHCDQAVCVYVHVSSAVQKPVCVCVVLSAEEASLVLFLAELFKWSSEGLVGFPLKVSLSPTSPPPLTDLHPPPRTRTIHSFFPRSLHP